MRTTRHPDACSHCAGRGAARFKGAITMAFQPIFDLTTGGVWAQEALVRGREGQGAAEVLAGLGDAALYGFDQECRITAIQLAARLGLDAALSINFMPNAVYDPRTCIQRTLWAAETTGFPIENLIFEFSETERVRDTAHVRNIVDAYRAMGFRTALDDFGAGHSGLSLLAEVLPDIVKLDRALVAGIDRSPARRAILRGVQTLCADLGIDLVAEGVERPEELAVLAGAGVTLIQGWLLARPVFEGLQTAPDHPLAPRAEASAA